MDDLTEEVYNSKESSLRRGYMEVKIPLDKYGRPVVAIDEALPEKEAGVLLISDDHYNRHVRGALNLVTGGELRKRGYSDYLIEAPRSSNGTLALLGRGKVVDIYSKAGFGPMSFGDRSFADAIYAMLGSGMRVEAIDVEEDEQGEPEFREGELFQGVRGLLIRVEDR